jgi:hypothetical protein
VDTGTLLCSQDSDVSVSEAALGCLAHLPSEVRGFHPYASVDL